MTQTVKVDKHEEGPHKGWNRYYFKYNGHTPFKLQTMEEPNKPPYSYISMQEEDFTRRCDQDMLSGVKFSSPWKIDGVLTPQAAMDIISHLITMVGRAKNRGYDDKASEVKEALSAMQRTRG